MNFNLFNSIPLLKPKRNAFNLSHSVKLTMEMGQLVPFYVQDVLPSDRLRVSATNLIKFAPLIAPILSEVDVYLHFFFVPTRLIWDSWEDFITGSHKGKKLPEDSMPQMPRWIFIRNFVNQAITNPLEGEPSPLQHGSLADYLGFQTFKKGTSFDHVNTHYYVDQLPFRAYRKIYNDWYRDENLQEDRDEDWFSESGDISVNDSNFQDVSRQMRLENRAWRKDYFTSALPFAQKGDDVLIPGGISVDPGSQLFIHGTGGLSLSSGSVPTNQYLDVTARFNDPKSGDLFVDNGNGKVLASYQSLSLLSGSQFNEFANSGASEGTIRELRRAMAAQRFLERRAVGGTRYIEQIRAFFGVKSSDARLQRSQFLGGCKNPVVISQVLQTSETTQSSPLGQPAGNAVSAGGKYIFDHTFEEYGYVVGLISVVPKADYIQGIPKMYLRRDVYDFYFPQFAKIGEQPIENQELYFDPTSVNNDKTFGYTPRYAEYRFRNNRVCGDFRDSLKFWTLARDFDRIQNLNSQFITCDPSTRIFAYENSDFHHLWCEIGLNVKSLRPLPKYGEQL